MQNEIIKKLITIVYSATLVISISILSGCQQSNIVKASDPASAVINRETPFTKELACFGDMLTTYRKLKNQNDSPAILPVAVVSVKDKTGVTSDTLESEIPKDMTDTAIGSLAKIGGVIRIMHLPTSAEYGDAQAYKQVTESNYFHDFSVGLYSTERATLLVYGNLTEYDRTLQNNKSGWDGQIDGTSTKSRKGILKQGTVDQTTYDDRNDASGGLNFSKSHLDNLSRMTIDFRVVKIAENRVVNESVVTNTILLRQNAEDLSFGVNLNGKSLGTLSTFGVGGSLGYSDSISLVDARHAAVRMLIERSLIEVIGKSQNIPYWRCLAKEEKKETAHNQAELQNANKETQFVIRPNQPVKLSEEALNAIKWKKLESNDSYPNLTMIDDNHKITDELEAMKADGVDISVINSVKRSFEKDDYISGHHNGGKRGYLDFIKRPNNSGDNRLLSNNKELRNVIAELRTKYPLETPQWLVMLNKKIGGDIIEDKKEKKNSVKENVKNTEQTVEKPIECKNLIFNQKVYHETPMNFPQKIESFNEIQGIVTKFFKEPQYVIKTEDALKDIINANHYVNIDTKSCLFERVIKAYNVKDNNPQVLYNMYGVYGKSAAEDANGLHMTNNPDFYTTLWLNIPVELNARWKY